MSNIFIIGAGQLGSRHLQGVLKYRNENLNVFVSDPSLEALKTAGKRASEVEHNHLLFFVSKISELPSEADVAIVSTNSNVREMVIGELLGNTKVKYLLLEKVLFQEMGAYSRVAMLLKKKNVICYVNHPRRMTPVYNEICKTIKDIGGRSYFSVVGESWDLGCNALHMLDLFVFFGNSPLKSINTDGIDSNILESKRSGYVEFTGSFTGLLENNDAFAINSFPGKRGELTISAATNGYRWLIQEGGTKTVIKLAAEDSYAVKNSVFFQDYQSNLTTNIIESFLIRGVCHLPDYSTASHTHELFIESLLEKYNTITNLKELKCPIT